MKHGFTQAALAKALGVIPVTVARWEAGARAISPFLHLALERLECGHGGENGKREKGGTSDV